MLCCWHSCRSALISSIWRDPIQSKMTCTNGSLATEMVVINENVPAEAITPNGRLPACRSSTIRTRKASASPWQCLQFPHELDDLTAEYTNHGTRCSPNTLDWQIESTRKRTFVQFRSGVEHRLLAQSEISTRSEFFTFGE